MGRRFAGIALVAAALTPPLWLAWQARDMPHLGYAFHDDSVYWVCAKSLAEGEGYRIASLPGQPYETKYPPLYPLLLAGVWRISPEFPENLRLAAALAWAMLPLSLAAAWPVFRDLGFEGMEPALAAALALNPYYAVGAISLLSELPFTCLLLLALALVERARRPDAPGWLAAAAGVAASAAYLTRSAALPLLAAGTLAFALGRQYRRAAAFAAGMLPGVVAWNAWVVLHRAPGSDALTVYYTSYLGFYAVSWRDLAVVAWKNADSLLTAIGGMFVFGLGDSFWGKSAARVLGVAAIAGMVRLWRKRQATALCYSGLYLTALLFWNFMPDQRFVVPVYAMLGAGLFAEARNLVKAARSRAALAVAWSVLALVGGVAASRTYAALAQVLPGFMAHHRQVRSEARGAYRWIAENVPAREPVLAYSDTVLYLHTGRHACRLVFPPELLYREDRAALRRVFESLPEYAHARGLRYAVLTPADMSAELGGADRLEAQRAFRASPRLKPVYESPAASVYRLE